MGLTLSLLSQENDNVVRLNLEGRSYDTITLKIVMEDTSILVDGTSGNKYNWEFIYPDSVYDKHEYMDLIIPDGGDSVMHKISFNILLAPKDSMRIGSLSFQRKETNITARFYRTEIIKEMPFFNYKDFHNDIFTISKDADASLYTMTKAMHCGYSMFARSRDTLNYDQRLKKYIDFTKGHSNSHYLAAQLFSTLTFYKSRDDISKVFDCFSENNKQSYFGQKIKKYLTETFFENSELPTWDTGVIEPMITDTSKYSLIVFSASWCGPCHKQIPQLKKIYKELNDKLNLIYISLDEEETVNSWKKLMEREQIPWRSLLAAKNVDYIKKKYTAQTIPLSILVYPGSYMETIDVRNNADLRKLYQMVEKQ